MSRRKPMTEQQFITSFMVMAALIVFTCFLTATMSLWGILIIDESFAHLEAVVEGISVIP